MTAIPKECLILSEYSLVMLPQKRRELKALNEFISSCCHAVAIDADPSGLSVRPVTSPQEKIVEMKEQNRYYQWLTEHVQTLSKFTDSLNEREYVIVDLLLWQNIPIKLIVEQLHISERNIYKIRQRLLLRLSKILMPLVTGP